ncbi:1-deoxy-D-xylulose-5-phosphate synthase [Gloeobacter violaceus]|uniref:1-deoxy-D-xylulose-5-phosphate synthase n=1 Tax=Gloeobacter violaceus (strain ATCC 29082 / PCC 7421) TaxID=251221 RepID=DXS_GLOVI|nr:1-deoxy-D-xylulose-5-phosphate synthase [Gloeobacter violaceus]Q7NP63.1 RecName: Full=1-deoxy-D-xylulose-5-phosphate synthase; AltName: Full=1-deoxyxylulose-5-phosphate synthase; Short=DXP synthase; Short=DXPS [Gloeobacter violaceus PCC 7421]BAC88135.1 1-deoxy-xylulose 5-phosphate synthase [Gloeobacter violaceus PCC 7421]
MNLSDLSHPNQLRDLSVSQLGRLAQQIRDKHLQTVAATGGHLGPGLGVVELTLALYKTLDLDRDRVVWDVGHQAYPHKMLTGRYANFHTLRQKDGLAGYLKRAESPFDCWGAGHASTSISAALGMALARDFQGLNRKVVAIIGDGALTGGMALEALNHAGHLSKTNLMVILNDNEMSISENVGGLSLYLNRLRTDPALRQIRSNLETQLRNIPLVGPTFSPEFERFKDTVKYMTMTRSKAGVIFEELGFTYLGPIDGHNLGDLIETFEFAHSLPGPVFLHAITVKGKGYEVAEQNQIKYHAQSAFDLATGKAKPASKPTPPAYTSVFAQTLVKLAEQNEKIVGITAAMPTGTGLDKFKERFADRYFDVGIAEQHAVTMAAGLAADGMRPVAAIYSTFLQRAFDQIIHDVAIQDLPVFFCLDRAGVVGEDGPTHHGVFDLAYLRQIPGLVVMAPKDEAELQRMMVTGIQYTKGPIAVRYPRGSGSGAPLMAEGWDPVPIGKAEVLRSGDDLLIVAIGTMVHPSLQAAALLSEHGIDATVVNARFAKPLDTELLLPLARRIGRVVTVEEGCRMGGFGSAVLEALMDGGIAVPTLRIGIDDKFVTHAGRSQLLDLLGLTPSGIAKTIRESLSTEPVSAPRA